jgi:hypothetical protein
MIADTTKLTQKTTTPRENWFVDMLLDVFILSLPQQSLSRLTDPEILLIGRISVTGAEAELGGFTIRCQASRSGVSPRIERWNEMDPQGNLEDLTRLNLLSGG